MSLNPKFDGPRLLRAEELGASSRLSEICFGHLMEPYSGEDESHLDIDPVPWEGETYLIASGGSPVSQMALFFTPLCMLGASVLIGSIGGVCTHPEYRGLGLATQLLEHSTRRLVEGGARFMLISGGRGLYTRVGCVPVRNFRIFTIRPGQLHAITTGVTIRPACEADASECSRIYAAEPVHFVRSLQKFQKEFTGQELHFQAERWIVELDGKPAAYLLLNNPWEHIHHPELGFRCVLEYAGSRAALAHAVGLAMQESKLQELEVPVLGQDIDFTFLLQASGGVWDWGVMPGHTLRVINFPGLMRDLEGYVDSMLPPEVRQGLCFEQAGPLLGGSGGDIFTISHGDDRMALDGAAMTTLLFGGVENLLEPAPGALAEVVSALFPLPVFHAGLDYH